MTNKFKPSKKHISIFRRIIEKGYYRPTYSDQEPATKTLENNGLIEWKSDYTGLILTNKGKEFIQSNSLIDS